jgi:hypothetical protein
MGEKINPQNFLVENLKERGHFEELKVNVRIILKWILRNRIGGCAFGSSDSGQGPVESSYAHGTEQSGSVKSYGFLC